MDLQLLLQHLNDPQRSAVLSPAEHLLVLAGAGSGKTRVLVHRIAYLVAQGLARPEEILAVTFTNKAAKSMRARLEQLLGGDQLQHLWMGTFHGIAHRLLRLHPQAAGLPPQFTLMDSDDQLRLIRRLLQEHQIDEQRWSPRQVQHYINQAKDEAKRAHQVLDYDTLPWRKVYLDYEAVCRREGWVDFGELLLLSYEMLLQNDALARYYQDRFKHILVDEFQDTNTLQDSWLRLLIQGQASLTLVGDDDQSIYAWRGARVDNMQRFCDDFPNTAVIRLEQNYRSTDVILQASNALIVHNSERLGKSLWTEGAAGQPIDVYAAFNELDEARFVVAEIQKTVRTVGHSSYRDHAILYRSNAQSRVLEELLLQHSIPYRVYGGMRFFERTEVKDALAYLRLILSPQDNAAFERVMNVPVRGLGDKTLELLRNVALEQGISLFEAAKSGALVLTARAGRSLWSFVEWIEALRQESQGWALAHLVDVVLQRSELLSHYAKEGAQKMQMRAENLAELVSAARFFSEEHPEQGLQEFLAYAVLEGQEKSSEGDCVQLMTLHSAKGLEFPYVYMTGLEEGLFPHHGKADDLPNRLEEERRLCYVGMTRAMRHLTLTYAQIRRVHARELVNLPSRFIREIPSEHLNFLNTARTPFRPAQSLYNAPDKTIGERPLIGESVLHPLFGSGVVLQREGEGVNARLKIRFAKSGEKWLLANYVTLSP